MRVGGVITALKEHKTRNGKRMAFVTLEDFGGSVELIVFSDVFSRCRRVLRPEHMLVAEGEIGTQDSGGSPKVKVSELFPLSEARDRLVDGVDIRITALGMDDSMLEELKEALAASPGKCEVRILVDTPHHGTAVIRAGAFGVDYSEESVDTWCALPIVDEVKLRSRGRGSDGWAMA